MAFTKVINDFLESGLFEYIRNLITVCLTIGIFASVITEAIKRSDDKVFLKKSLPLVALWYINVFNNLLLTCLFVVSFPVGTVIQSISFIIQVWFISWALSILAYDYFLDSLFTAFSLFKNWLKSLELKMKIKVKEFKKQLGE